jgi:UDP-N-acetylglucosamine--N-acetylmuramyl-(pentapeptide) pyrophosphoryl-undecaprenol N-acetylglucosamine transferase
MTVAARFAAEHDDVVFVGTPDGLEASLVPRAGIEFVGLPAKGYDRARPLTMVTSSVRIAMSTIQAARLLRKTRPDVVVGFGGYVSIPVGFAARLTSTPLVLHEQNSVPGMANVTLSRWAQAVGVTYPESGELLAHPERAVVTGNPVRPAVLASTRAVGRARLDLPQDALVLLAFGGSRGARHLNSALIALRDRLLAIPELHIVQVAGRTEYAAAAAALEQAGGDGAGRWHLLDYFDEMGLALASADLVVARAGATSIAEITALGLPSVLVPYPYATDDHQTKNARACVENGASVLVPDAGLDGERFGDEVLELLSDPARRATMAAASRELGRPDAAERVVTLARSAALRGAHTD